jgi:hypothetical protein
MKPGKPTTAKPVLMQPEDIIHIRSAAARANRCEKTIRRWVSLHGIGRHSSRTAPLEISAPGLVMVLQGDFEALELLRAGDRHSPSVYRYLAFLGLV